MSDAAPRESASGPAAELLDDVRNALGETAGDGAVSFGEVTLTVPREGVVETIRRLRDDPNLRFVCFVDLCGVDYPEREERFEVVYHFLSPYRNRRIRLKVRAGEDDLVPSIVDVFPAADWYEREAFDLYGIVFSGHPDLRRILTDYGFDGYPLRKDFPMTGFVEVRYDESVKQVVYEPVALRQEMRNFDFLSPWEGTDYVLPGDEKAKAN